MVNGNFTKKQQQQQQQRQKYTNPEGNNIAAAFSQGPPAFSSSRSVERSERSRQVLNKR